ncbi:MAG TPA: hypothetical protein VGC22_12400 [Chitinophaga sp.]
MKKAVTVRLVLLLNKIVQGGEWASSGFTGEGFTEGMVAGEV